MKSIVAIWLLAGCFICCKSMSQQGGLVMKKALPHPLKEISGIVSEGNSVWAISDKPQPVVFKLSNDGGLQQQVTLKDVIVTDVEAITSDGSFLYVGDIGDNNGTRASRSIYKVALSQLGAAKQTETTSQQINFTFPDKDETGRKKENDFDCEAMLAYRDSIYLFTKRRIDDQSELFVVPDKAGTYVARAISMYNTQGLITDAAINPATNQVVLTGYGKGHDEAFIWIFKNFKGSDFFNGTAARINFSGKNTEWQVEGVSFKDNKTLFFRVKKPKKYLPACMK